MNLQSIVITNCIGIALTMLVVYSSHTARKSRTLESRMLTVMLVVLSSCCLMEMVSFLVDGHTSPAARIAAWVSNMWIYLATPGFSVLWLLYTDYHLHRKTRRLFTVYRVHLILLGICWTVILGNIFGGYLFSFTEDNVYYRQPLSYVFFGLPLLVILLSQAVFIVLYAAFVAFPALGKDYDAAVLVSGLCGFGLGATPNAMANMSAVCFKYHYSVKPFIIVPIIGAMFVDIINTGVITLFLNLL